LSRSELVIVNLSIVPVRLIGAIIIDAFLKNVFGLEKYFVFGFPNALCGCGAQTIAFAVLAFITFEGKTNH
jgi:hypothetical protein